MFLSGEGYYALKDGFPCIHFVEWVSVGFSEWIASTQRLLLQGDDARIVVSCILSVGLNSYRLQYCILELLV